jgi:hypothetical protein
MTDRGTCFSHSDDHEGDSEKEYDHVGYRTFSRVIML